VSTLAISFLLTPTFQLLILSGRGRIFLSRRDGDTNLYDDGDNRGREAHEVHSARLNHLQTLEAESISILREAVAEFARPVMLYSIGKDSSVMLRLAQKAFYPGRIPFPLLHVDTSYKFPEMIRFRDEYAREIGADLIVHRNEKAIAEGANPYTLARRTAAGC